MTEECRETYQKSLEFWNKAFTPKESTERKDWKEIAPSQKLRSAAESFSECRAFLDYGCGTGWAGILAAKAGCGNVTCVDVNPNAIKSAGIQALAYGVADQIRTEFVDPDWICMQKENAYDGFFCSNVLDVVPTEIALRILEHAARIVKPGSPVVLSFNYYMEPEKATERGYRCMNGNEIYIDGILRLVTRTDAEWKEMISRYFTVEKLEYFAWPGEQTERRRLFYLRKPE